MNTNYKKIILELGENGSCLTFDKIDNWVEKYRITYSELIVSPKYIENTTETLYLIEDFKTPEIKQMLLFAMLYHGLIYLRKDLKKDIQKELLAKQIMEEYLKIKDNDEEVKKWLKNNLELGLENAVRVHEESNDLRLKWEHFLNIHKKLKPDDIEKLFHTYSKLNYRFKTVSWGSDKYLYEFLIDMKNSCKNFVMFCFIFYDLFFKKKILPLELEKCRN